MTWNRKTLTLGAITCCVTLIALGCSKNNPSSSTAAAEKQAPAEPREDDATSPEAGYSAFGGGGSASESDYGVPLREEYVENQEEEAFQEDAEGFEHEEDYGEYDQEQEPDDGSWEEVEE